MNVRRHYKRQNSAQKKTGEYWEEAAYAELKELEKTNPDAQDGKHSDWFCFMRYKHADTYFQYAAHHEENEEKRTALIGKSRACQEKADFHLQHNKENKKSHRKRKASVLDETASPATTNPQNNRGSITVDSKWMEKRKLEAKKIKTEELVLPESKNISKESFDEFKLFGRSLKWRSAEGRYVLFEAQKEEKPSQRITPKN